MTDHEVPAAVDPPAEVRESEGGASTRDAAWQKRLLPLMQWMLVSLTAFFVVATLFQARVVQRQIDALGGGGFDPVAATAGLSADAASRVRLEAYAMRMRYQHSGLILMSRAWIIYLGFVTGMILAMVGATFILGKILTPPTKLEITGLGSLLSSSPGLVLAALGTALMVATMVTRADVTVTDTALYVPSLEKAVVATGTPAELKDGSAPAKPPDDSQLNQLGKEAERRGRGK